MRKMIPALMLAASSASAAPATDAQLADYRARIDDLVPRGLSAAEIIWALTGRYGRQFTMLENRNGTTDVRVQDGDGVSITYFEIVAVLPATVPGFRP